MFLKHKQAARFRFYNKAAGGLIRTKNFRNDTLDFYFYIGIYHFRRLILFVLNIFFYGQIFRDFNIREQQAVVGYIFNGDFSHL